MDSNFNHPTFLCKSNNYSPVMRDKIKSNFLSSGCFLLSILLIADYEIFIPLIKIEVLIYNVSSDGKSNLSSIFSR